jgi:hypothetical protein
MRFILPVLGSGLGVVFYVVLFYLFQNELPYWPGAVEQEITFAVIGGVSGYFFARGIENDKKKLKQARQRKIGS